MTSYLDTWDAEPVVDDEFRDYVDQQAPVDDPQAAREAERADERRRREEEAKRG